MSDNIDDDNETIPSVIASSTIKIFDVELKCHILDNGARVIEQESMEKLFETMEKGNIETTEEEAMNFAKWLRGRN